MELKKKRKRNPPHKFSPAIGNELPSFQSLSDIQSFFPTTTLPIQKKSGVFVWSPIHPSKKFCDVSVRKRVLPEENTTNPEDEKEFSKIETEKEIVNNNVSDNEEILNDKTQPNDTTPQHPLDSITTIDESIKDNNENNENNEKQPTDSSILKKGQWILSQKRFEGLFFQAKVLECLPNNTYTIIFEDDKKLQVKREQIISSSSIDHVYGISLPVDQKVLARCPDGFFYPGIILSQINELDYKVKLISGNDIRIIKRKNIYLEGETSIGNFKLQIFQKVMAKWRGSTLTSNNEYFPALIVANYEDLYSVTFQGDITRILNSTDIALTCDVF